MKPIYYTLLLISFGFISCQKELSFDSGTFPVDTTTVPVTPNNCKLAKLNEKETTTGSSTYTYISSFDTEHKVSRVDVVDSSRSAIYGSFAVSYPSGRVQLGTDQYFVTGSDGKVTEFHGFEDPENRQGSKVTVKYTYNTSNQLTLRTFAYDSVPGVVFLQMKFTWTAGNMTREIVEFFNGVSFTAFGQLDLTYDASKTVKPYTNLYGASFELITFQTAINSGAANVNPVTRAVVVTTDPTTGTRTSTTSNFTNYLIDSKNYIQSFQVSGDDFSSAGFYANRTYLLSYHCY